MSTPNTRKRAGDTGTQKAAAVAAAQVVDQKQDPVNEQAPADAQDTGAETPAAVVVEEVAAGSQEVTSDLQYYLDELRAAGAFGRDTANAIVTYLEAMNPLKPNTEVQCARQQRNLQQLIRNLLYVVPRNEFRLHWSVLLMAVKEHRDGVFNERFVMRGAQAWTFGDEELGECQALLHLLIITADPAERADVKSQLDFKKLFERLSDEGVQRLTEFYNA